MVEAAVAAEAMETSGGDKGQGGEKAWHATVAEDLHRTTDSALRSARSRSFQDYITHLRSQYNAYEDAFFKQVKDGLMSMGEYPLVTGGVAITAGFLLRRGPRRFLFRHTVGRLQSEDAKYARARTNVKDLSLSIDLLKADSKKLHERVSSAERDLHEGHMELMNTGRQIQRFANLIREAEVEAMELMDDLREIPGGEALKQRAKVASMASFLKLRRRAMDQRIREISELGVRV